MKIMLFELKKIFRPLTVAVLILFTLVYAYTFLSPDYKKLTEYHETTDFMTVSKDIIELAGTSVEPGEVVPVFTALNERYTKEFNAAITNEPKFAEAGVEDYEDYYALEGKIEFSRMVSDIMEDGTPYIERELELTGEYPQIYGHGTFDPDADYTLTPAERYIAEHNGLGSMVDATDIKIGILHGLNYDAGESGNLLELMNRTQDDALIAYLQDDRSKAVKDRLREIFSPEEQRNVMPYFLPDTTLSTIRLLCILIIVLICFLLAPLIMRDNMNGTRYLQYSSRTGRKILSRQLAAMLTSTFILTTAGIGSVAAVFLPAGWGVFLDSKLNGMMGFTAYWFSGTFGQYLILMALLVYLLAFACTLIIFLLSRYAKNYIGLLLTALPCMAFFGLLSFVLPWVPLEGPLRLGYNTSPLHGIIVIPHIEVYCAVLLLATGTAITAVAVKKNRTADIA
jgi:hypothetical protein